MTRTVALPELRPPSGISTERWTVWAFHAGRGSWVALRTYAEESEAAYLCTQVLGPTRIVRERITREVVEIIDPSTRGVA